MRKLAAFCLIATLSAASAFAASVPLVTGPQDVSQLRGTLNTIINNINAIITPMIPNVPNAVNIVVLLPAATGGVVIVSPGGQGSDANAPLGLSGAGNGNIILFAGHTTSTGIVQFANSTSWRPAPGLGTCPGGNMKANTKGAHGLVDGPHSSVRGFIPVSDWLGRVRWLPGC